MSVELIESMGNDLSIVNAARVSYGKESHQLTEADRGLIGYLMKNRHGTPFEMVQFKFRVKVPIGVAREWQRHRMGSFNEVSTRYVEMKPEFYMPPESALRMQVGKPGHYVMEPLPTTKVGIVSDLFESAYNRSFDFYQMLLDYGVAKELARNVLPLALLTEFIWSVNLRSLMNFLNLRTHASALLEIRQEAELVESLVRSVVPVAMDAWQECGRLAP